jgi:hypothetical protein
MMGAESPVSSNAIVTRGLDHGKSDTSDLRTQVPNSGKPEFEWSIFFSKKMDCRVKPFNDERL